MTPEEHLVVKYGERARESAARRVIKRLQREPAHLIGGDDSALGTTWDEMCIQVQGRESVVRSVWEDLIDQVIHATLKSGARLDLQALYLRTPEGEDCAAERSASDLHIPIDTDAIAAAVRAKALSVAADWSNDAIRARQGPDYLV